MPVAVALGLTVARASAQCDPEEIAHLVASDAAADDGFGVTVAVHEDTAVVGAWIDDHAGGENAGSAYVFERSNGIWTEQAKLTASDAAPGDMFGATVAIHGDTIVVGAVRADHEGQIDAGCAYVFVRSAGVWTEQAKLVASDGEAEDLFGSAVAVHGDTALIGSPWDGHSGVSEAGSAYVFVRSSGAWTQEAKLVAPAPLGGMLFGGAVATDGNTAAMSASFDRVAGMIGAGSTYVFVRSNCTWVQQSRLTASDAARYDCFGASVAIDDGTLLVGAHFDDHDGMTDAGSVYVFECDGDIWIERAKLTAADAAARDKFGSSVALEGETALIGAPEDDHTAGEYAGSAYVFVRRDATWSEAAKLVASDGAYADEFGRSVSMDGDTGVIGSWWDDHAGGADAGSAYVFDLNCIEPLPGDVDGDGDVDLSDVAALLAAYRACAGDPDYNPAADFDDSGCVDLSDLAMLLANYGLGT